MSNRLLLHASPRCHFLVCPLLAAAALFAAKAISGELDRDLDDNLQRLYKSVEPAIVRICSDEDGTHTIGVGVVTSADGFVITSLQGALL